LPHACISIALAWAAWMAPNVLGILDRSKMFQKIPENDVRFCPGEMKNGGEMDIDEAQKKFRLTQLALNAISGVVAGYSNKEIGDYFQLGEQTVKHFLFTSCEKLGVTGREELKRFAIEHELPLTKLPPKS
jgi:DNA-binding NarL/FixJ family response regulator